MKGEKNFGWGSSSDNDYDFKFESYKPDENGVKRGYIKYSEGCATHLAMTLSVYDGYDFDPSKMTVNGQVVNNDWINVRGGRDFILNNKFGANVPLVEYHIDIPLGEERYDIVFEDGCFIDRCIDIPTTITTSNLENPEIYTWEQEARVSLVDIEGNGSGTVTGNLHCGASNRFIEIKVNTTNAPTAVTVNGAPITTIYLGDSEDEFTTWLLILPDVSAETGYNINLTF